MSITMLSDRATRIIGAVTAAALLFTPAFGVSSFARSSDVVVSGLSLSSDPVGADVFVDGQLAGRTPLALAGVPVGPHRVRFVKSGYLDNSRVVSVAERPNAINVHLTRNTNDSAALEAPAAPRLAPGGGSKKWLWIGLGAAGAVGAAVALLPKSNKAPSVGGVSASAAIGLAGATSITFTASGASDPDGDSLSYSWDFGNGVNSTNQSPSVVFPSAGTFTVTVTVSDSKKSASASTTVTIKSMTGTWRGSLFSSTLVLTQSGTTITGTYSDFDGPGTISAGSVASGSTSAVRFTINQPQVSFVAAFIGNPDANVNVITGTLGGVAFTLTRQ